MVDLAQDKTWLYCAMEQFGGEQTWDCPTARGEVLDFDLKK